MVNKNSQKKSKAFLWRFLDLWVWFFKYDGEGLSFYYVFDFDVKSREEQRSYLTGREYQALLIKENRKLLNAGEDLDYRVLTSDKFVANNYLESIGVKAAHNEALIHKPQCVLD